MRYVIGYPVTLGLGSGNDFDLEKRTGRYAKASAKAKPVSFTFADNDELYETLPELVPEPLLKMWAAAYLERQRQRKPRSSP